MSASSRTSNVMTTLTGQKASFPFVVGCSRSGTTLLRFELNRAGEVIASEISKSSGNTVLDREALELLHRASPFPPFPAEKPGARDSYLAPVAFAR